MTKPTKWQVLETLQTINSRKGRGTVTDVMFSGGTQEKGVFIRMVPVTQQWGFNEQRRWSIRNGLVRACGTSAKLAKSKGFSVTKEILFGRAAGTIAHGNSDDILRTFRMPCVSGGDHCITLREWKAIRAHDPLLGALELQAGHLGTRSLKKEMLPKT